VRAASRAQLRTRTRTRFGAAGAAIGIVALSALGPAPRSHAREGGGKAPGAAVKVSASPGRGTEGPLNVVLVTIDSLRADMPWTGYHRDIAPRLTELEARAVSYRRAYALSSYTAMSIAGLLASRLPSELDRDGWFFSRFSDRNVFFPDVLHRHGVRTLAGHAHGYFKHPGFERGFDVWELVPNLKWNPATDENVTSDALERTAERLLGDASLGEHGPFFAWFHFMDPHDRYVPHEGCGPYGTALRDRYDAEVTFTDRYVGKLVDFVGQQAWGARTAIVVTADHGEALGEKGQYAHGFELWEHLVRVPLFFVVPGAPPRRIDEARSALDLGPTVLELMGVPREPSFRGTSLVGEVRGDTPPLRDVLIDLPTTSDNEPRRALVRGEKKLIAYPSRAIAQLYDLDSDPQEAHPVYRGPAYSEMVEALGAASRGLSERPPTGCKAGCLKGVP
jgi:arylsulfatase A-like enzyme